MNFNSVDDVIEYYKQKERERESVEHAENKRRENIFRKINSRRTR